MNEEIKEILDYLGNDNIEKPFGMATIDKHNLLDYITNLQQENERLKEENKHIFANVNDDELLISNAMNYAEAQDYKSRIDKAIEYINKTVFNEKGYINFCYELENILKGDSDE